MNKGEQRRKKRRGKYHARYDRIILLALLFIETTAIIFLGIRVYQLEKKEESSSEIQEFSEQTTENIPEVTTENITEIQTTVTTTEVVETVATTTSFTENFETEKYEDDDIYEGMLAMVNSEHEYKFTEDEDNFVKVMEKGNEFYNVSENDLSLESETVEYLNRMMKDFAEDTGMEDTNIWVVEGRRDYDTQNDIYNSGSSVFKAGYSEYHTGRIFDLAVFEDDGTSYYFSPKDDYEWFEENAAKYGFIVRFPENKEEITGEQYRARTYQYVGVPHAEYMYAAGLCLEEYIDIVKGYNTERPLEFGDGEHEYMVYYVSANEKNEIPVPKDYQYTVSGDNSGGLIVTAVKN